MFEGISVLAGLLFGGIKQYQDTKSLNHGEMYREKYAVETTENVTGGVGVWAGVEYGGMLGTTLLPDSVLWQEPSWEVYSEPRSEPPSDTRLAAPFSIKGRLLSNSWLTLRSPW
jgi:hypothetical protein